MRKDPINSIRQQKMTYTEEQDCFTFIVLIPVEFRVYLSRQVRFISAFYCVDY